MSSTLKIGKGIDRAGQENRAIRIGRTGRSLGDGLAHFSSNQLHEVAFYIVTRFSNHAGSKLGFSVAALMRF